ncbi:retrovirus-related pol polyprotein from transposon TNT 1-94 [Tanacetum coccineum]
MEILVKKCLMPLALKTQNDSLAFIHELKQEMHADLKYVESLEDELDELESDKAEFSNMYDMLFKNFAKKRASNVFRKEREQYVEIQDLKAQMQDKNMAISKLKKLVAKCKGKSVDTKFDKPSVVRQPNAQRIPKPSVLGKPAPFSDSLERIFLPQKKSVQKLNESEGLFKPGQSTEFTQDGSYQAITEHLDQEELVSVTRSYQKSLAISNPPVANYHKTFTVGYSKSTSQVPRVNLYGCLYRNEINLTSVHRPLTSLEIVLLLLLFHWLGTPLDAPRKYDQRVSMSKRAQYNLFSVGQFCDADLEVAFRKSTCFVRDLQGNDLLSGNRGSDLYTISLQETTSSTLICLLAKDPPTQAWLWHRRLSHLNFDYINLLSKKDHCDLVYQTEVMSRIKLCSSCECE